MHVQLFRDMRLTLRECYGDIAEIGVFRGHNFVHLAQAAAEHDRVAHGFDSFRGMDTPSVHDGDEYPKGKFNVGGVDKAFGAMRPFVHKEHVELHEGYVPHCFDGCDDLRFAFVYIDLDHCDPTAEAIRWAAPRVEMGGILAFDDWFPNRTGILAGRSIKEWLARNDHPHRHSAGRDLWLVKDREWTC